MFKVYFSHFDLVRNLVFKVYFSHFNLVTNLVFIIYGTEDNNNERIEM